MCSVGTYTCLELERRRGGVGRVTPLEAAADAGLDAAGAAGLEQVTAALEVTAAVAGLDLAHVRHDGDTVSRTVLRGRRTGLVGSLFPDGEPAKLVAQMVGFAPIGVVLFGDALVTGLLG